MKPTCSDIVLILAVFFLLGGCNDESSDAGDHDGNSEEGPSLGVSTQALCSTESKPSYGSFGKGFMDKYCVRCHSSTLRDAARNGAPEGHDFDRLEGILPVAEHIDQYAAWGPAAQNVLMPPSDPKPSAEERRTLGEWLACEAD